jgi:CheY-like chemotaxis protein
MECTGVQLALADPPDVLVLDLGLPGLDGLRVCERLRSEADRHIPILMLTARDTLDDKLQGFAAGADDYLVKPFAGDELLARCLALSRRHRAGTAHQLRIGSLCIDRRSGVPFATTALAAAADPYRILLALAEAWPRTLTRSELLQRTVGRRATAPTRCARTCTCCGRHWTSPSPRRCSRPCTGSVSSWTPTHERTLPATAKPRMMLVFAGFALVRCRAVRVLYAWRSCMRWRTASSMPSSSRKSASSCVSAPPTADGAEPRDPSTSVCMLGPTSFRTI